MLVVGSNQSTFEASSRVLVGALSESFTAGICYSSTIHSIGNAVQNSQSPADLAKQIHALPLEGYETVCTDVEAAAEKLPNAGAP